MSKPEHPHGGPPGHRPDAVANIIANEQFGYFPAPPNFEEGNGLEWHPESWRGNKGGRPCLNLGQWTHPSEGLAAAVFYKGFGDPKPLLYISFLTFITSLPTVRNVELFDSYGILTNTNLVPPRSGNQEAGNIYLHMEGHNFLTYGSDSTNVPGSGKCPLSEWFRVWLIIDSVTDGGFIQAETLNSGAFKTKAKYAPGFVHGPLVFGLFGPMQACEVAITDLSISTVPFRAGVP